ncbi:MAG: 30S ribosomal protein S4 [Candidatus Aenigmarchaeota archaeon]|nr:30S ribosomal protein S4 [Candidatus Aenigmarchaeota archaeon]
MRKIRSKIKPVIDHWNEERIASERELMNKYGLRRKKELRIAEAILRGFRNQAKQLLTKADENKKKVLFEKLQSLNVLGVDQNLDDVLSLALEDILERRLQTIVNKKGFAKTVKQSRQMITHGRVCINSHKITFPSYLVRKAEEDGIMLNVKGAQK